MPKAIKIRFTPRRPTGNWSAINIVRMRELIDEGRAHAAGITAFQKRVPERSGVYSYENRKSAKLSAAATKLFRAESAAWEFFRRQPPSYRQMMIWWVVSARRPQTQKIDCKDSSLRPTPAADYGDNPLDIRCSCRRVAFSDSVNL